MPPTHRQCMAVGQTLAPASKRLKTSFNEFQDDDQAPALPVDELVTYVSEPTNTTRDSRRLQDVIAALVAGERASCATFSLMAAKRLL